MTTLKEKKHMNAVAELGCAVCRRMGYAGTQQNYTTQGV